VQGVQRRKEGWRAKRWQEIERRTAARVHGSHTSMNYTSVGIIRILTQGVGQVVKDESKFGAHYTTVINSWTRGEKGKQVKNNGRHTAAQWHSCA